MNNRLGKSHRVLDNTIWKEYKKTYPPKKYSFESREELKTVVKEIFKVIAERMVDNHAGVFIRDFGYLFNWKVPSNPKYTLTNKEGVVEKRNFYGEKNMHLPVFIPCRQLEGWSMDNTFNRSLKQDLKNKLKQGTTYKMFAFSFKSLLK